MSSIDKDLIGYTEDEMMERYWEDMCLAEF